MDNNVEYQIETLRLYGERNPQSGLQHKVKRISFGSKLDVIDPITGEIDKKPLKQFMVNQLQIAFERGRMKLSPWDTVLHKQLTDYVVEKIGANGIPIFTSENEHYVDALGLAHLAFVQEFPELTNVVKRRECTTLVNSSQVNLGRKGLSALIAKTENASTFKFSQDKDADDLPGDKPKWFKTEISGNRKSSYGSWGSRSFTSGFGRSSF